MKRPVSLAASLISAVLLAALPTAGCSAAKTPGKEDVAQACMERMGGVQQRCDCYVATIEKSLTPDQFTQLAKGAYDNRNYAGADWLPNNVSSIPGNQHCIADRRDDLSDQRLNSDAKRGKSAGGG